MKKTLLALSLALASMHSFAEDITIKFSHVTSAASPKGAGAEKFKELVEKYTDGKVKVEVGHSSTMFNDNNELAALRENKVQMLAPSLAKLSSFYKVADDNPWVVNTMPFLFKNRADFAAVEKAGVFKDMNTTLDKAGSYATVLAIWDNGLASLSTTRAIKKYSDLATLKPRIQPSNILKEQWAAWGANARILPYNELLIGTFYGAVDSSENPPSNFYGSKLMPTQKYFYTTEHSYLGYAVMVNKEFWSKLPADVKPKIEKAFEEATAFEIDAAQRENQFSIERMQATGLVRVLPIDPEVLKQMKADSAKVVNVLSPLQKSYYDRMTKIIASVPKDPAAVPVAAVTPAKVESAKPAAPAASTPAPAKVEAPKAPEAAKPVASTSAPAKVETPKVEDPKAVVKAEAKSK